MPKLKCLQLNAALLIAKDIKWFNVRVDSANICSTGLGFEPIYVNEEGMHFQKEGHKCMAAPIMPIFKSSRLDCKTDNRKEGA